jgi:hypothetical protein
MRDKHEPRSEFIERLQSQITTEVQRRNRLSASPRWPMASPWKLAAVAAVLVIVSMAAGGAAVAAAYQAQSNERRDILLSGYMQRLQLTQQRLDLANRELQDAQQKFQMGLVPQLATLEAQLKVAEVTAQLKTLESEVQEIRLTGSEPLDVVSAPVVGGRDFVTERLSNARTFPQVALQLEESRLQAAQRRVAVGIAEPGEVEAAQMHVVELKASLDTMLKKLTIRQQLLRKEIDATRADLLVLEADAQLKVNTLKPRITQATRELERVKRMVNVGTAQNLDLAQAQMKLAELNSDLAAAELELLLIQQKLKGKMQ